MRHVIAGVTVLEVGAYNITAIDLWIGEHQRNKDIEGCLPVQTYLFDPQATMSQKSKSTLGSDFKPPWLIQSYLSSSLQINRLDYCCT